MQRFAPYMEVSGTLANEYGEALVREIGVNAGQTAGELLSSPASSWGAQIDAFTNGDPAIEQDLRAAIVRRFEDRVNGMESKLNARKGPLDAIDDDISRDRDAVGNIDKRFKSVYPDEQMRQIMKDYASGAINPDTNQPYTKDESQTRLVNRLDEWKQDVLRTYDQLTDPSTSAALDNDRALDTDKTPTVGVLSV